MLFAIYLCYCTRAAPSNYREVRYVSWAVYNETIVSTVFYICRSASLIIWKHIRVTQTVADSLRLFWLINITYSTPQKLLSLRLTARAVNGQIKTGLLLSLSVKKTLKSANIWQSYKQERGCLVHFLRILAVCWLGAQSTQDNHVLACNFAKYSQILLFFHWQTHQ